MSKRFTKELIISTAFEEWGKSCFKNMSLILITNKLKITKPALYRYFKNKKELLDEMSKYLFNELGRVSETLFNEIKNIDKNKIILLFIKVYFEFFGNNLYYFLFYIFYSIKDNYFENEKIIKNNDKLRLIFSDYLKESNLWISPDEAGNLVRYIFSTGFFLTIFSMHDELKKNKVPHKLDNAQINYIIKSINKIVTTGFKSNRSSVNINFKKIEDLYFTNEISYNRNKIFESIAKVVAKYGLWDASIKKIADDLNMSKSSLYLYFKNKKEMISDMIRKEIEHNNNRVKNNISNYNDFFEKLYSAVITISASFVNDKKMILVFDWFHYQGMNFKDVHYESLKSDPFYIIFQEAYENKIIKIDPFNLEFLTAYLKMQILKEILLLNLMKRELSFNDIRFIFKIFLNGLSEEKK